MLRGPFLVRWLDSLSMGQLPHPRYRCTAGVTRAHFLRGTTASRMRAPRKGAPVSERLYRFVCADNCESLSYEIAEYLMNSDLVVRAEEDGRVLIHRGLRARHRAELAYELTHGGPPPETHQIALPPEAVARARKVPTSTRLYRFIFDGR